MGLEFLSQAPWSLLGGGRGQDRSPGYGLSPSAQPALLPGELAQGRGGFAVKGKKILLNLGKKKRVFDISSDSANGAKCFVWMASKSSCLTRWEQAPPGQLAQGTHAVQI